MRELRGPIPSYDAPSNEEIARRTGVAIPDIVRFDGNTSPGLLPSHTAEALAEELARVNTYPHGGYPRLERAIADYAGVAPENVVLGAGADDLILLAARSFAGPGERIAIANDPTYPLFEIAARLSGADVSGHNPSLTILCRPNNPTGELPPIPDARPLVVDEAYYEYSGETAAGLIEDEDVIVIRTFSKAFALAGARIGYALAGREIAADLNRRQNPAPVSTLSAALAIAALEDPPDVQPILYERERFASRLGELGLDPWPSCANFVYVPADDPTGLGERLLRHGLAVRPVRGGIRVTIRDEPDDERLLAALATEM